MQRAMALGAEAERERRAKVIHADGEFQASKRLRDAADIISENPAALQLRYLQTLTEIGGMNNSTVVFPPPLDIVRPFVEALGSVAKDAPEPDEDTRLEGGPRSELTEAAGVGLRNGADQGVTARTSP